MQFAIFNTKLNLAHSFIKLDDYDLATRSHSKEVFSHETTPMSIYINSINVKYVVAAKLKQETDRIRIWHVVKYIIKIEKKIIQSR